MDEHPLELTAWVADVLRRLDMPIDLVTSPVVTGLPRTIRSDAGAAGVAPARRRGVDQPERLDGGRIVIR
jgi:hypothetical protein